MICVDASAAAPGDGSAERPFRRITDAIATATSGATILVAAGTYGEDLVLEGRSKVELLGGFPGARDFSIRDPGALVATLRGSGSRPVIGVRGSNQVAIDGFRITGGGGEPLSRTGAGDVEYSAGGGIYVDEASRDVSIRGNAIEGNALVGGEASYDGRGGGIATEGQGVTIARNVIRGNRGGRGAGVWSGETAETVLDANIVEGNVGVGDHGGGLFLSGRLTIARNVVRANTTGGDSGWGGGMAVVGGGTQALLEGNVVTDNHAPTFGSGVFIDDAARATLRHELYYRNRCSKDGGVGLAVDRADSNGQAIPSVVDVHETTIVDHDCPATQGGNAVIARGSTVILTNVIVWRNGGKDFLAYDEGAITATYTLSAPGLPGVGNFAADPLFADPAAGDYHVRSVAGRWDPATGQWVTDPLSSPTIDRGDPSSPHEHEPQPNGGTVNLGHTGNTPEASKSG